ncbi:MAG: hydroxyacylglutathione hydrolase [Cyanobacteria bacterium P01_E01_bin.48]
MEIYRIPAFKDNYVFLLFDARDRSAAVVDPGDAAPVLSELKRLDARLTAIFNTHHHSDHVGGNRKLLRHFPNAAVYASAVDRDRIPGQTVKLQGGDRVHFGGEEAEVLFVPGHTRGHIAYYFRQSGHLFCGDTLFGAGCGRLFEGTPAQMVASMTQLRALPDDTHVWCAHEYTLNNLKFAVTVDGDNAATRSRLERVYAARDRGEATVPLSLGVEKQTNPFLRWDDPALQAVTQIREPTRVFARLRGMKDRF